MPLPAPPLPALTLAPEPSCYGRARGPPRGLVRRLPALQPTSRPAGKPDDCFDGQTIAPANASSPVAADDEGVLSRRSAGFCSGAAEGVLRFPCAHVEHECLHL